MGIQRLDHVNLVTSQLGEMVAWYQTILGLRSGPRPDFPFPGAWLYAESTVMVHLVGVAEVGVGSEAALKLEHFAFRATGATQFEARLVQSGTKYRKVVIDDISTVAFNIWDPDGNHIHVDFADDE